MFFFFFEKKYWHTEIISLDFTTVMLYDLLVSVTTIKMVSTVRVNGSLLDYQYKCIEPLRENHMNMIFLFQAIETFPRIFNDSY